MKFSVRVFFFRLFLLVSLCQQNGFSRKDHASSSRLNINCQSKHKRLAVEKPKCNKPTGLTGISPCTSFSALVRSPWRRVSSTNSVSMVIKAKSFTQSIYIFGFTQMQTEWRIWRFVRLAVEFVWLFAHNFLRVKLFATHFNST